MRVIDLDGMPRTEMPPPPLDHEACWSAVLARDASADGRFVTAVRSTGINCRPGCSARRPRRENVTFFTCREEAEAAGFRACKRCRPDEPSREARATDAVARACRLIDEAETPPALAELARAAGMSAYHFHRTFRLDTGVTPKAYAAARRASRVEAGLRDEAHSVTQAVFDAGFNATSRFYADSRERLGMTPSASRRGEEGATIRFAVAQCSLGPILVAATAKGVCAILFGEEPDALVREVQDRFPRAELNGADPTFERLVARVVGLVERPDQPVDLPLDIGGTAFQQRVWEALRKIPAGQTASYAEIARAVGAPAAMRAVGRACGANPVAVAIPCHRVVATNGSLTGYRWGVARKRRLLARERGERDEA